MSTTQRAAWLASPLVAATAFLGIWGFDALVRRDDWLRTTFLLLLLTVIAVVVTRLFSRGRTLPTLVGLTVAVVAMVPAFAVTDRGEGRILPTPWALIDLVRAFGDGIHHAATTVPPASAAPGLVALITAGLLVMYLVADYLAVGWGAAGTAGLVLLGPWIPAVVLQHHVPLAVLVSAIALWLVVLALTNDLVTAQRRPAFGGALTGTVATLAVVLVVAPLVVSGPGWGTIPRFKVPSAVEGPTRLNLAVDLRNSLTTRSTTPVIMYESTGMPPSAFKLYTLTDFDGSQWEREETERPSAPAAGEVLWPSHVDGWTDRERLRIEMQVLDLEEPNLPLPPTPRVIDIEGRWYYDSERDEVVGHRVSSRDARYAVETDPNLPLQEDLESIPAGRHPSDADLDRRYLHVAGAIDSHRVESLAQEITAGATTRHGQAVALQNYLRNTSDFTYDTSVQPSGNDAISTFLDDREGYCIHFATTMVVMARTLDIPARMGHGFLPGSATSQGTYVVEGGDAHVWPEIWFPEQGWVRFEPTPAIQSGAPPGYADPLVVEDDDEPHDEVTQSPEPTAKPEESLEPTPDPLVPQEPEGPQNVAPAADGGDGTPTPTVPLWAWLALGALATAAGVGALMWRARVAGSRNRASGPEAEWESLRARLPESMRWGTELTPYEAAESMRVRLQDAQLRLPNGESERAAQAGRVGQATTQAQLSLAQAMTAITSFAATLSHHRYAPPGSPVDTEQLRNWADQVVAGAAMAEQVSV